MMKFYLSLLFLASLLATAPTTVRAAKCKNRSIEMDDFLRRYEGTIWSMRRRMCGDGECGNDQECTLTVGNGDSIVEIYRKDVQREFPNCWVS